MRNLHTTLLYRWFQEVWNNSRESAIDELMAEGTIAHGITEENGLRGPEGFKSFYNNFRNQFSNIRIAVDDVVSQDDLESARCSVQATHTESGKEVQFSGICMVRIKNGKITEAWNNFDFMSMFQQLGHKMVPEQV